MSIIKTPDQRVRVFISSTINELADERKAARQAIENLRLIPVFFEAGARPHPPRDLYSAYLEQSHIFLGIYWNSYGWTAPGASLSGLEDEYRLCGQTKPKLIYVKKSADRQEKLLHLLSDIEKSETACYQQFGDAQELQKLIENDLSVLMSEIFENALLTKAEAVEEMVPGEVLGDKVFFAVPNLRSELFGRDEDLKKITTLLIHKNTHLLTLLGAGGTGKSTLAIQLGQSLKAHFKHGIVFIPLAPVTDHHLVSHTIAAMLEVQDSGKQPIEHTLTDFLSDKELLLILDNFEQVVEASKFLSDLLLRCHGLKMLVTSRTTLHIRGEHIYNLSPLALPDETIVINAQTLENYPATKLFVERALEVNPTMEFTAENTAAILDICRRMDGLPLAIELAAARTRFFQPAALMKRIDKTLDLVSKGHKDLPERQQTLRAAIEWSYNLLSPESQKVFRQLGIFKRSWTLEAADVILNDGDDMIDIEIMTESLLDVSLIKPVLVSHSAETRFNMLQTVHEYANEMLDNSSEGQITKMRYAQYFYQLCRQAEGKLWTRNSEAWLDKLEYEYQNIRAAFYIFIQSDCYAEAWDIVAILCAYWTVRGGFSETLQWITAARIDDPEFRQQANIPGSIQAKSLTWAGYAKLFLFDLDQGFVLLNEAEKMAITAGDEHSLMYALMFDGCYGSYLCREDAPEKMQQGLDIALKRKDTLALCMYYCWSYEYYRQQGDYERLENNFRWVEETATDEENMYILGALYILRFAMATMNKQTDWQEIHRQGQATYHQLPAKGYKGLKAAALMGSAYALMQLAQLDEAGVHLRQGLEYARTAGEMESNVYGAMEASPYLKLTGQDQKAYQIWGALDNFIELSGYPLIGGSEAQYNYLKEIMEPDFQLEQNIKSYEQGKKIRIEDAIMLALH